MTTIAELREQVRGPVIEPGEDGYEEHRRVHNGMHDRRPALIVRAAATADAVAVVNYARDAGLDLAVRGGGHSVPGFGTCDGGVVLDLVADEQRVRGPRQADGPRRRRRHVGRLQPRHPRLRPRHHRRDHLDHRGRRPDPGRRHRLSHARLRTVVRQPGERRGRHRRRPHPRRERVRERGPVLGAARRQRQLRCRHLPRAQLCTRSETIYGGPMFFEVGGRARGHARATTTTSRTRPSSSARSSPGRSPRRCRSSRKTGTATCSAPWSPAGAGGRSRASR